MKYLDSLSPSFEMLPNCNNIPFRIKNQDGEEFSSHVTAVLGHLR